MSLDLRERLRPIHAVLVAIFLVGTGVALARERGSIGPVVALVAVLQGLFAVLLFRFTVEALWRYLVGYRATGGAWTDVPIAAPAVAAVVVAVGTYAVVPRVGVAAWAAFWAFVVVAGVVALAVQVLVGYREAGG